MKVLINTPSLTKPGGVANHYKGLRGFWSGNVKYSNVGGRYGIPRPIILFFDYIIFFIKCLFGGYNIIVLNPSLGKTAIQRDAIFLSIARFCGLKSIVFFHGWDPVLSQKIDQKPSKFIRKYGSADAFIVLAYEFKKQMHEWGLQQPIFVSTTKVDNELVEDFDLFGKKYGETILFLARVEHNKGVFIALDAFKKIQGITPKARLIVAGSGSDLKSAKKHTADCGIKRVEFLGNISGRKLIDIFKGSDLYILPTSHGEGMPTSVLEAMAFGLPVITRPVGGLSDFFEDGKMGALITSTCANDFSKAIVCLLKDKNKMQEIGRFNHEYAKRNFMASEVAAKLENFFKLVLSEERER